MKIPTEETRKEEEKHTLDMLISAAADSDARKDKHLAASNKWKLIDSPTEMVEASVEKVLKRTGETDPDRLMENHLLAKPPENLDDIIDAISEDHPTFEQKELTRRLFNTWDIVSPFNTEAVEHLFGDKDDIKAMVFASHTLFCIKAQQGAIDVYQKRETTLSATVLSMYAFMYNSLTGFSMKAALRDPIRPSQDARFTTFAMMSAVAGLHYQMVKKSAEAAIIANKNGLTFFGFQP